MKKLCFALAFILLSSLNGFSQQNEKTNNTNAPTSYHSARPINPKITNNLPRHYITGDDLYTPAEAITSDLQKNNFDKILFGKTRIDKNGGTDQLVNTFKANEGIYGRAFMRTCMMNHKVYATEGHNEPKKCMEGNFEVNYSIDGKDMGLFMSNSMSGEMEDKTTFSIVVVGKGEDAAFNNEDFIQVLNELAPGSHTIRMVVWATQGQFISVDPVAFGEFTYVKGSASATTGLGRNFNSVKEEMNNPELKAKCLKKLNDHAKINAWKETFTEVKITDEDWTTQRNELTSVITGRVINIAAKATWPDGHCTYQTFSIRSDYDGTAYSNAIAILGIGEQTKIDCK